jgi:hypothetical protein
MRVNQFNILQKRTTLSAVLNSRLSSAVGLLQRKCACGGTPGPTGECEACRKKRLSLQRRTGNLELGTRDDSVTRTLLSQQVSSLLGNEPAEHHGQETDRIQVKAQMPLPDRQAASAVSWNSSKISIFAPGRTNQSQVQPLIQPKLVLGEINDPFEHEADRIADQVMRMPVSERSGPVGSPCINRKCARWKKKEEQTLQTAPMVRLGADLTGRPAPPVVHDVLNSPGQPLDAGTQHFMESRFGHDFSAIRIHTGRSPIPTDLISFSRVDATSPAACAASTFSPMSSPTLFNSNRLPGFDAPAMAEHSEFQQRTHAIVNRWGRTARGACRRPTRKTRPSRFLWHLNAMVSSSARPAAVLRTMATPQREGSAAIIVRALPTVPTTSSL